MSNSLRERLAHLIAACESPCVREATTVNLHPGPMARYHREFREALNLPLTTSRIECFERLANRARKLDAKLEAAGGFPPARPPTITTRHQAEAAMRYLSPTYVGGTSQAEQALMAVKGLGDLAKLLDRVAKARNLLAVMRYTEGDFHFSPRPPERIAAKAIDLMLPYVTDYWADLLVIDRDAIVDRVGRGESLWLWTKVGGWGTWLSEKPSRIPDGCSAIVEVSPEGAKLIRRYIQLDFAA